MLLALWRAGLVFKEPIAIQVGALVQPIEDPAPRFQELASVLLVARHQVVAAQEHQIRARCGVVAVVVQPGRYAQSCRRVVADLLGYASGLFIVEVIILRAHEA